MLKPRNFVQRMVDEAVEEAIENINIKTAINLFTAGYDLNTINAVIKLSFEEIEDILIDNNLLDRKELEGVTDIGKGTISEEKKAEVEECLNQLRNTAIKVIELYFDNLDLEDIAKQTNLSVYQVEDLLRENELIE